MGVGAVCQASHTAVDGSPPHTDGCRERVSMTQDNGRPGRRLIWVICGLCRVDHAATVMEGETPPGKIVYRGKSRIPSPRHPPNQTSPPTDSSMSFDACFTFRPLLCITGGAGSVVMPVIGSINRQAVESQYCIYPPFLLRESSRNQLYK